MCELCWQPRGYTSMTIYIHLRIAISTLLWNQWTLKVWQASGTGAVESARERRGRLLSKHFFSSERGRRFVCPAFLFLLFDSFFFFMLAETDAPSSVYREEGRYSFLPTNDDIPPIRLHPINPSSFLLWLVLVQLALFFLSFLFRWRIVVVVGWHAPINCLLQLEPFTWPIYLEWDATGAMGVDGQTKKWKDIKKRKKKKKRKQFRPASFLLCLEIFKM